MGCRDGSRGAKARTNEFSTARKAREVVERSVPTVITLSWSSSARFSSIGTPVLVSPSFTNCGLGRVDRDREF